MAWVPKVNRHAVVMVQKTVAGNTQYVKRRPAIITGFATDTNPIFRVRHNLDKDPVTPGIQPEVYGTPSVGIVRVLNSTTTTPGGNWRAGKYCSQ